MSRGKVYTPPREWKPLRRSVRILLECCLVFLLPLVFSIAFLLFSITTFSNIPTALWLFLIFSVFGLYELNGSGKSGINAK